MKLPILLIFLFISAFTAHAQHYKCLQQGPIPFFTNSEGYLRAMRIDSVRVSGTDTIYYPFRSARGTYVLQPLNENGGSWLGKNVIERPDGTFLFDNMWNDTVVIRTQAMSGETWMFFNDTSQIWYTATLTSIDTMTVLGSSDSVKHIRITAYRDGLINIADSINGFEMILSKEHGFIQTFDLFTFPYHPSGSFIWGSLYNDFYLDLVTGEIDYLLIGGWTILKATNVKRSNSIFRLIPFYNPTLMEVYEAATDDEAVYKTITTTSGSTVTNLESARVTSKVISAYSTTYTTAGKREVTTATPSGSTIVYSDGAGAYSKDTSRLLYLDQLPEEWGQYYYFHYYPEENIATPCKAPVYRNSLTNINFDTRYYEYSVDFEGYGRPHHEHTRYALGYGQIDHAIYHNPVFADVGESGSLISANKSGVQCGPYVHVGVTDLHTGKADEVTLYPNPTTDLLNISVPSGVHTVTVSDIQGRSLLQLDYNAANVQVDVRDLPAGIYFLKVNSGAVRKFVKQ